MQLYLVDNPEPRQSAEYHVGGCTATNQPVHLITFVEQELRKLGTILPGNPSNQSASHIFSRLHPNRRLTIAATAGLGKLGRVTGQGSTRAAFPVAFAPIRLTELGFCSRVRSVADNATIDL